MSSSREPAPGSRIVTFDHKNEICEVIDRPNRFIVRVSVGNEEMECHLHDPGRLKELIYPGNRVLVRNSHGRRTSHSITAAQKDGEWILTDSRFHNPIARQFLKGSVKSEVKLGISRIDFLAGNCYVEVKGCSLERNGIALFPDAPSKRASRHAGELITVLDTGMEAMIIVLVFSPNAHVFAPNNQTDPEFHHAFYGALSRGVQVSVLKFRTDEEGIIYIGRLPVLDEVHSRKLSL